MRCVWSYSLIQDISIKLLNPQIRTMSTIPELFYEIIFLFVIDVSDSWINVNQRLQ